MIRTMMMVYVRCFLWSPTPTRKWIAKSSRYSVMKVVADVSGAHGCRWCGIWCQWCRWCGLLPGFMPWCAIDQCQLRKGNFRRVLRRMCFRCANHKWIMGSKHMPNVRSGRVHVWVIGGAADAAGAVDSGSPRAGVVIVATLQMLLVCDFWCCCCCC